MKSIFFGLFGVLLVLFSCQNDVKEPTQKNTAKATKNITVNAIQAAQITGEWESVSLEITTAYNTPNQKVETYSEAEWASKLKIKPIKTIYKSDGTFSSEYRDLKGELFDVSTGNWSIKGDSVVLNQLKPDRRSATYQVKFSPDNTAIFTAVLDWTNNGKRDDLYVGKQRHLKK